MVDIHSDHFTCRWCRIKPSRDFIQVIVRSVISYLSGKQDRVCRMNPVVSSGGNCCFYDQAIVAVLRRLSLRDIP